MIIFPHPQFFKRTYGLASLIMKIPKTVEIPEWKVGESLKEILHESITGIGKLRSYDNCTANHTKYFCHT